MSSKKLVKASINNIEVEIVQEEIANQYPEPPSGSSNSSCQSIFCGSSKANPENGGKKRR